jgi:serine phosphatase RsbU (regulator of sigma subunit)/Tfp pilus assembly protein PilF
MKNNIFITLVLLLTLNSYAQQKQLDSLNGLLLDKNVNDTSKIEVIFSLTELLYLRNFDTIVPLSKRVLKIVNNGLKQKNIDERTRIALLKGKATAYNNIGVYYVNVGKSDSALEYYHVTLEIQLKVKDNNEIATTYYNIGSIYKKQGKIEEALKYFRKALNIARKIKNYNQIGMNSMSIAMIYEYQRDSEKALEFYKEAEESYSKKKNKYGLSMVYHNLGGYYEKKNQREVAINYYEKALALKEEIGDLIGMGYTLNNLGSIYYKSGQDEKSLEYFDQSYNLFLSQKYTDGLANAAGKLSEVYFAKGDYVQALKYGEEAYDIAKGTGFPENLRNASFALYKVYDKQKRFDKAIEMYKLYSEMKDSMNNDRTRKASLESQIQFKFDKKTLKDSLEHAKENEVNQAAIAKQEIELKAKQNMQFALFGGLALVIVFAIFMYNRFRITQKQNRIIEDQKREVELQKHLVEEKHKEITDSINYAERIQKSFLASKKLLDENLNDYFILFKPKDVVSGDFYWGVKLNNGNFCLVAADSTGHGVPGSIMSILNITCLENAVKDGLTYPNEILNHTRLKIIERLKKDGSADGGKDGMDCSLLSFDFKNNKLSFALANNPLWLIRNGECLEYKADKIPVGKHDLDNVSFTHQEIDLQKGDIIFAFTDGFADQFGGTKGKKFKYSNLQKLLLENADIKLETLNLKLETVFTEWRGDLEQVDDVCIIGIRI